MIKQWVEERFVLYLLIISVLGFLIGFLVPLFVTFVTNIHSIGSFLYELFVKGGGIGA
jgi:hypothetical protein